nr:hypothetical protein [Sphingobacterium sp. JB170]
MPGDLVTHGRLCGPVPTQEHFPRTCHAFLPAQLVVEFPEQEEHLLLHLSGCVGGVDGLRYRYDLDTKPPQLIGEPDGIVIAGKALKAVHQDVGYLSLELLHEGDHGGKLLPFVGFRTFVGSTEGGGEVVPHLFGVERTGFELRGEAQVVGLLAAAHPCVDHAVLAALQYLGFFFSFCKGVKKKCFGHKRTIKTSVLNSALIY